LSISDRLTELAERVIVLEGWKAAVLAVCAGALSALSLAPYHIFPVLFFTFPIFIWLLEGSVPSLNKQNKSGLFRRIWPAFKTGWLFGFGYFLAGLWWIGKAFLVDADEFIYLLPLAVVALPAGLSIFWGIAAVLTRALWTHGWTRLISAAVCFTAMEYLRGHLFTGFPWNLLGYAFMPSPLFMQTSALIGVYGLTFITVLVAATAAIFIPGPSGPAIHVRRTLVLSASLVAAHIGYGAYVLTGSKTEMVPDVNLRIVQPAIDQSRKWDPAYAVPIMENYFDLTNTNKGPKAASAGSFTHIIWPESVFPFILTERRDMLSQLADLLPAETKLITGAMRREANAQDRTFNALLVIDGNGEIISAYDKTHLVPFGEYLPFHGLLESIGLQQLTQRGAFSAGTQRKSISVPATPRFLPLICYEIVFSGSLIKHWERPKWIVNLTNDAWFGLTAGPHQHAHQSRVRAVEEGIPLVRAANTGISMVVDPYGRVIESLQLGVRGTVDSGLPKAGPVTWFAIHGNWPTLILICALFLILVVTRKSNTNRL
jgi:apolipoprotein N-acyltransferase